MAEVQFNDAFYEVEASRWLKGAGAVLVTTSFTKCNTKAGIQHRLNLHARLKDGNIHQASVWPRNFVTDADATALAQPISDVLLRFGRKVTEEIDPETGETIEVESYGEPKWVACKTAAGWITPQGDKVPFVGDTEPDDAADADAAEE